jgi:DNA primase
MPRIPEETIQQVAAANDIVEVIGGYFPLKRAGTTYKALCPFHQERSPSFTVNPARQIFKCFGCGAGGSVFRFVMDYEHVDFTSAVKKLAEKAGIRIEVEELSPDDLRRLGMRNRLLALHVEAASFFHRNLLKSPQAQIARDYLHSRGIHAETAKGWQLGYAPDGWDHFGKWALKVGFSREEILASGLVSQRDSESPRSEFYDRFRGRVMFPICNDTGEVIAFSGRILEKDPKAAKYVNSPETPLFTKGAVLFGLHRSKRALIQSNSAIVCEGQIDLITAFESGIQNVIAPQGTAFTSRQARILKRYVEEVVLCFDSDAAGEKAAERSLPSLLAEKLAVRIAVLPEGQDPDSLIRGEGAEPFRGLIQNAKDFFEFQLEREAGKPEFRMPRGRAWAARKLADFMSHISDPLLREMQVQRVASRLELAAPEVARLTVEAAARNRSSKVEDPAQAAEVQSSETGPRVAALDLSSVDASVKMLALVLLHSREARNWLSAEDWRPKLQSEPDSELVEAVLEHQHLLDDEAGPQMFLSSVPDAMEGAFVQLFEVRPPEHPLAVAQDCLQEFEKRSIRRRIDSLKARQRESHLALEDASSLHQQILDLQRRLFDIARPFSPLR